MNSFSEFQVNRWMIYAWLSTSILNQPYPDVDNCHSSPPWGEVLEAHRPNHGTLHSIRQVTYVDVAIEWLGLQFSAEEQELLRLAVFLCRAGRTNEETHHADPTYASRSAEIFRIVVTQMGCFSDDLIERYVKILSYQPEDIPEADQAVGILELAHRMDLYRCWALDRTDAYLDAHLKAFVAALPDGILSRDVDLSVLMESLRRLSWMANYVTGNRLACFDSMDPSFVAPIEPMIDAFVQRHGSSFSDLDPKNGTYYGYRPVRFVRLTHDVYQTGQLLKQLVSECSDPLNGQIQDQ